MATFYASNATLRDNTVPPTRIPGVDNGGLVRCMSDSFSYTAAPTTSDVIKFMKLPSGAKLLNVIVSSSAATAGAINVGWEANGVDAANASGILAASSVASAATAQMTSVANAAGQGKQFGAETQISVVPSTTFTAASGTIQVQAFYSLA